MEHKALNDECSGMSCGYIRRARLGGCLVKSDTPIARLATAAHIGFMALCCGVLSVMSQWTILTGGKAASIQKKGDALVFLFNRYIYCLYQFTLLHRGQLNL